MSLNNNKWSFKFDHCQQCGRAKNIPADLESLEQLGAFAQKKIDCISDECSIRDCSESTMMFNSFTNALDNCERPVEKDGDIERMYYSLDCFEGEDVCEIYPPAYVVISENRIRIDIRMPDCEKCKAVFTVDEQSLYKLLKHINIHTMDILVETGGEAMFEFFAFNLPGCWWRFVRSVNIMFCGQFVMDGVRTLVKKSRGLSVLRLAHQEKTMVRIADIVASMAAIEKLEFFYPEKNGYGYTMDVRALEVILKCDKFNGETKPFRSLRLFGTKYEFGTASMFKFCETLSRYTHNAIVDYGSMNEMIFIGYGEKTRDGIIRLRVTSDETHNVFEDVEYNLIREGSNFITRSSRFPQKYAWIRIDGLLFYLEPY
ncbi:unnamed protein product [Caenorhabditis bovis]|uniref:Uncharacterized protein n=1 Tax=Caenorhabditis bovis TaxID=2654633 RepID=A0A8S1FC52_9PELO|nr:unnamed protein product [Caenorhabditis bovis]